LNFRDRKYRNQSWRLGKEQSNAENRKKKIGSYLDRGAETRREKEAPWFEEKEEEDDDEKKHKEKKHSENGL